MFTTRFISSLFIVSTLSLSNLFAQKPDFSLVGFATQNGGTIGGEGGTEVVVTNFNDLKKYAETPDIKYIIKISGTIKGTGSIATRDYDGSIRIQSNKSIIGIGNTAFLDGVGFTIHGVNNVIVRNIKFSMISLGKNIPDTTSDIPNIYSKLGDEGRAQILVNSGDLISISAPKNGGITSNVWIDHCEFYQEDPRTQTNQDLYDGLLDIKNDSRYITVSWCYFHDHHKCSLIGSSDKDIFKDRKITFHHNFYKTVQERVPLYRGGEAHFFNNYLFDVYTGSVNTRVNACVKVEKNYFEKSENNVYSKNSVIVGQAEIVDNEEIDCKRTEPVPGACQLNLPYEYSKSLTKNPKKVKAIVTKYAGVGVL